MATIDGTNGADVLNDTSGDDIINALEGDDLIIYTGGADTIDGGDGVDTLQTTQGLASFSVVGNANPSFSRITGPSITNIERVEFLDADGDLVVLYHLGGVGDDIIDTRESAGVVFDLNSQTYLYGGAGNDTIYAAGLNNSLWGGEGNDTLYGSDDGTNIYRPGTGTDTIFGGDGTSDTLIYSGLTGYDLEIDMGAGTVEDPFNTGVSATFSGIENVTGSDGDDFITGDGNDNRLVGGLGTDILFGEGGDDFLSGGRGNDTLVGGEGQDRFEILLYEGGDDFDTIEDFAVNETITVFLYSQSIAPIDFVWLGTSAFSANGSAELRYEVDGNDVGILLDEDGDGTEDQVIILTDYTGGLRVVSGQQGLVELASANIEYGTSGNDNISPNATTDIVEALDGDDVVTLLGPLSEVYGGAGTDQLNLEALGGSVGLLLSSTTSTSLTVFNRDATERYATARDFESFILSTADDAVNVSDLGFGVTIDAQEGDDIIEATGFADTLFGGGGNDTFISTAGDDTIDGGEGFDRVTYYNLEATAGVVVDLRTGVVSNDGLGGEDTLTSIEYVGGTTLFTDRLDGDDNNNTLTTIGGAGDIINGHGGNDLIAFETAGQFDGGEGVDTLYFFNSQTDVDAGGARRDILRSQDIVVDLAAGTIINDGYGNSGTATNFENVRITNLLFPAFTGLATVYGTDGDNEIRIDVRGLAYGLGGDDLIVGSRSNDTFLGGDGDDRLFGDVGVDLLYGEAGEDFLSGGAGNDFLYGGVGNDTLEGGAGVDILLGEAGSDELIGGTGDDVLYGGADNDALYGGEGVDNLLGGEGGDELFGGDDTDLLYGEGGDDTLRGQAGNDYLYGGFGNDVLDGGDGTDYLLGGAGNDELFGGAGTDVLYADSFDADTLFGGQGDDFFLVYGDGSNVTLVEHAGEGTDVAYYFDQSTAATYTHGANIEFGLIVTDTGSFGARLNGSEVGESLYILGSPGEASLYGMGGNDVLYGSVGRDLLYGGDGDDTLISSVGNDVLDGGAGTDILYGEAGDDLFITSDGLDYIYTGLGNDTIRWMGDATRDAVVDFTDGSDVIDVRLLAHTGTGPYSFADVALVQSGNDAIVQLGGFELYLFGVDIATLDAADFVF